MSTTYAQDAFTDSAGTSLTSHTPDVGPAWATGYANSLTGTGKIADNGTEATGIAAYSGGGGMWAIMGLPDDYRLRATLIRRSGGDEYCVFLLRAADADNCFKVELTNFFTACDINKRVGGAQSNLDSNAFTFSTGVAYELIATLTGPVLDVTIDGAPMGSGNDGGDNPSAGSCGFFIFGSEAGDAGNKSFLIQSLVVEVPDGEGGFQVAWAMNANQFLGAA